MIDINRGIIEKTEYVTTIFTTLLFVYVLKTKHKFLLTILLTAIISYILYTKTKSPEIYILIGGLLYIADNISNQFIIIDIWKISYYMILSYYIISFYLMINEYNRN